MNTICFARERLPRRWWFGTKGQPHRADPDKTVLKQWGHYTWELYELLTVCTYCGARNRALAVDHADMIAAGFTAEQLEAAT